MATQKVSDTLIDSFPSSKLTGALPVIDGSAITGVGDSVTKSASDPAINTNPSGGVSHVWVNTTSGEIYSCTDATTDANVWTNVGGGDGNITPYLPGSFGGQGGGSNYGYHVGGMYPGATTIQGKYSFTTDGNSTSVASLTRVGYAGCGCQSPTVGYAFGMDNAPASGTNGLKVMKHIFASNSQSEIGGGTDLSSWHLQGSSPANSLTHAYTIGGGWTGAPGSSHANYGGVQKMSFATESTMTFVGTAYNDNGGQDPTMTFGSGHSSLTHGYRAGGHNQQHTDKIEKWPFATDADSAFAASLASGVNTSLSGASSDYHGYLMGGNGPGQNLIAKFSFSTDSDSTDVGDLHTGEGYASGTSSQTHGYMAGGGHPQINNIQKVSFTTDGNATDVGDIIQARAYCAGYHN